MKSVMFFIGLFSTVMLQAGTTRGAQSRPVLPDVIVSAIAVEGRNLVVKVQNQGHVGKGATVADFTIGWTSAEQSFPGNTWYRRQVPPPGQRTQIGGLMRESFGLKRGMEADVEVIIAR